jgi:hypothetical protein
VKDPHEALAAARRAAASSQSDPDSGAGVTAGGGAGVTAGAGAGGAGDEAPWSLEGRALSSRRLAEWAIIEPDETRVRSTRPWGRPLTAGKLLLVRLLRQYIGQMSAQQSRFNAHVAAHVMRLEERVAELEQAAQLRAGAEAKPSAHRLTGAEREPPVRDGDPPPA